MDGITYIYYFSCLKNAPSIVKKMHEQASIINKHKLKITIVALNYEKEGCVDGVCYVKYNGNWLTRYLFRHRVIGRYIRSNSVGRVILRATVSDFSSYLFYRKHGKGIIVEHHALVVEEIKSQGLNLKNIFMILMSTFFNGFKFAAGHISVTDEVKKHIDKVVGNQRSVVISNGFDIEGCPLVMPKKEMEKLNFFIIASQFFNWQGLPRILNSIEDYNRKDVQLHLIGGLTPSQIELVGKVNEKLTNKVVCHGILRGDDLYAKLSIMHIGIDSMGMYLCGMNEASSLKARLYLASGIPFVTSIRDPDVIDSCPFVYSIPNDNSKIPIADICQWFQHLSLQNESLAKTMRSYALEHISWYVKLSQYDEYAQKVFM